MRCVLHIGTEKTGSTAIQQFLYANAKGLRDQGVHVCQSLGEANNRLLPAAFMGSDRNDDFLNRQNHENAQARQLWKASILKRFEDELSNASKTCKVFVISSEHLHSRLISLAEVQELADFLRPMFQKIDVLCYLRRQDEMAVSRYSQALRAGHVFGAPVPRGDRIARDNLPPYFDFKSLLERWADAFGEYSIMPIVYSSANLREGNVVLDFVHEANLKIDVSNFAIVVHANSALSAEAQTVLLGVNKALESVEVTQHHRDQYLALVAYLDEHAQGESLRPTKAEAISFCRAFEACNHAVAQRWFGREVLFDEDFSRYGDAKSQVDPQEVAALLAGFQLHGT